MYLGIDYGLTNIGLATAETDFATPLETIKAKGRKDALSILVKKISTLSPTRIIIGISEGKSRERAQSFGKDLQNETGIRIDYVDETLSTKEAETLTANNSEKNHAIAAAIILQRFLDEKDEEDNT